MRILHLTDTHLGFSRPVQRPADPTPRRHLLQQDAERALRAALAPALHGEVDAVVHTGDLFDRSKPPRRAVLFAAELLVLAARRVPVVVMAGNHDRKGLLRHLPMRTPHLHVVDRPERVVLGGVALGVVPFERTAAGFAVAAQVATGPGVDLLLAHQAFDGHMVPTRFQRGSGGTHEPVRWFRFRAGVQADTVGEAHLPRGTRWVLCGHLHPRQVVQVGGATVVCPGSTVRTSFTERTHAKGTAIWTLGSSVGWQSRPLPARAMHVVEHPDDLSAVRPTDLVRISTPRVRPEDVLARGAWLFGTRHRAPDRSEDQREDRPGGRARSRQLTLL